ncbi:MAG: AgmX/PglI C-terminal domain-containing protein [Polyangiaceae bacterium]
MSPRFSVEAALKTTVSSAFTSAASEEGVVSASAPEGSYTYAMVPAGSVSASEVETSAAAIEVTVKWGASVLTVAHLSPMRSFTIGESDADFTVSREELGAPRVELVHVAGDAVTVPSLAKALAADDSATVELAGLTFEIKRVRAGKKVTGVKKPNKRALALGALGAALHAGVFAGMFAFSPALDATDDSAMTSDQHATIQRAFEAMAEKELKETTDLAKSSESSSRAEPNDTSAEPKNVPGSATTKMRTAAIPDGRMHTTNLSLSRADYIHQVQNSTMVELISSLGPISDNAAFWTSDQSGTDSRSTDPGMWSDDGPFDPSKMLNPNDGGPATQVKVGPIRTDCIGLMCKGSLIPVAIRPHHDADGPVLHHTEEPGKTGVAPELMQRVIRQSFGRYRACYENGLRTNPTLAGRVVVALTVSPDGSVRSATDAGSSLPDPGVVSCIVRNFASLNFPAAEGVGHIVYPLSLSPN